MNTQLPSRERLAEIHKLAAKSDKYIYHLRADEVEAMTRFVLAAHEQEPVFFVEIEGDDWINAGRIEGKESPDLGLLPDGINYLYAHPAPELTAIVDRLNLSGYEHEDGEVTPQNAAAVVDILLQQLDEAVQGRDTHPAPSVPAVVPDGYVLMPMKLSAENGAKYALSGEFHVLHRVTCHECGGEGCSDCDDDGWLEEKIMIGWDDIKDIYRAAVEACSIKSTGEGV